MTRGRLLAVVLIVGALLALLGWQARREELVRACLDSGGVWTGNACGPLRLRPILRRELQRSEGPRALPVSGSGSATAWTCRWT
ncbi:MAG TPA: hypothetical protein VFA64_11645 [Hyphomicrobiaceae bacterium]|nr:hypothetical protein [Hyphomicrobiaceae bacterium]